MKKFLIDVNLPYHFVLWKTEDFIHQRDINDRWSDEQIWEYAKQSNLTIISKDSDFSNRIILCEPPPRIIHIRFGNLKFDEFFQVISKNWSEIIQLSSEYKLVNVFKDRLEGIN